jgi:hypothetical protein
MPSPHIFDLGSISIISGSTLISSSYSIPSGSLSGSFTGSLLGTASLAISSSYPIMLSGSVLSSLTGIGGINLANEAIFLGTNAGSGSTSFETGSTGNIFLGYQAGQGVYASGSETYPNGLGVNGSFNVGIGYQAINLARNTRFTVAIGNLAGKDARTTFGGVFVGHAAGHGTFVGQRNSVYPTSVGYQAGYDSQNTTETVALGLFAGSNATGSIRTVGVGSSAGAYTQFVSSSVYIGYQAGIRQIGSSFSVLLGHRIAATNTVANSIGRNNIIIGTSITLADNRRDSINLGGLIFGTGSYFDSGSTSIPFSGSADGRIGINQPLPIYNLDVSGSGNYTNGLTITGSLTVISGSVELQVLNTGVKIGNLSTDTHTVTGSLNITGSIVVSGSVSASSFTGSLLGTAATASFVTSSNVRGPFGVNSILSASYASGSTSASFAINASTASFVTSSNVFGPFGSNSILSASYASGSTSASFAINASTASFVTSSNVRGPFGANSISSASYASGSTSASFASTASFITSTGTNAFVQGGNSFSTTAILGTNDPQNLQFETNGTVRMTITSSNGNVGIGTANPDAPLRVAGTVNSTHSIFSNIDGRGLAIQTITISGTNDAGSILNARGAGGGTLILQTDNTERVRVASDGNVGIGTISPLQKLDVSGSINVRSGAPTILFDRNGAYTWRLVNGDGTIFPTSTFNIANNASKSIATFLDGGNVGIGTTTPSARFEISSSATNNLGGLLLRATSTANNPAVLYENSTNGGTLDLYNSATLATRISSNGNSYFVSGSVGIGTNAPQKSFEVISTVNDFVSVGVNLLTTNQWAGIQFGFRDPNNINLSRKSAIVFERDDNVESNGAGKIHILNGPQVGNANATLSDARLTIGKDGNVGIGTRNPTSASLQVNGNVYAASFTGSLLGTASFVTASNVFGPLGSNSVTNAVVATTASIVNGTLGQLLSSDNRFISASEINTRYLQFGFTAWNNNNTSPYADYLHMRSYTDASGGGDNLVMFRKDTIGARIYQAAFGSDTAYTVFKDIALISGSSVVNYVPLWMSDNSLTNSVINQVSNYVGIDQVSPTSKLDVNGTIVAGNTTTTNGSVILQDQYSAGHITNFGTNFSSGGPVIGYCVYPSSSIENTFASSVTNALNIPRAAFSFDGSFRWYTGVAQALNIGVQATLTQKMTLTNTGDLGIGTASPSYKADISGSTRVLWSLAVGNITPSATKGRIDAENDVVAFSTSDNRFKTNVTPIPNALDKISQIGGYEFDWIPNQELHGFEGHDIGVIAQEIEKVLPEVVTTRDSGYKAVKYEKIVPLLIEAIKEQQKQIDELKNLIQNGITS